MSYHCRSALRIKSVHFRILSAIILEWVQLPVAWVQSVHFALSDWFKFHKISGRLEIGWSFDNTQITIVLHKKSTFLDNEIALRIANRAIYQGSNQTNCTQVNQSYSRNKRILYEFRRDKFSGCRSEVCRAVMSKKSKIYRWENALYFPLEQSRHAVSDLWSLHSLGRVCFSLDFSFILSNGVQIGVKSGHIIKFSPCCTSFTINCQCTDSQRKRLLHTIEDTESTFARRSCCVDVEVESIESCTSDKYN